MEPFVLTMPAPALRRPDFSLSPLARNVLLIAGSALAAASLIALIRLALGLAPPTGAVRDVAILVHLGTVLPALPLGMVLFLARKGTRSHKALGWIWMALMAVTAVAALFIRELNGGSFSLIHLFVPLTFFGIVRGVSAARQGRIAAHRRSMIGLFFGALLVAGILSFLPGRVMWVWLTG